MDNIAIFRMDEVVRLDPDRLSGLYAQLGNVGADAIVCRAMEELAARMSLIRVAFSRNELDVVYRGARGMVAIAEQIGLSSLARVAGSVRECAAADDRVALAATLERLVRVGDRSLTEIWDLQDLSV